MTRSHHLTNASIHTLPAATLRRRDRILGLVATVELWLERRRQRRELLKLNEHMLKDIGLSHSDAVREGFKPFWRA